VARKKGSKNKMIRPRGEKIKEEVAFILTLNLPTSLILYYNPDFIATGEMGDITEFTLDIKESLIREKAFSCLV